MRKDIFAFTLAETLITLVIIGVVAALTVPTMIIRHQKEETVTKLKKAYSSLAQTTARAVADYGAITTWELGEEINTENAIIFFDKYVGKYLSLSKSAQGISSENLNNDFFLLNNIDLKYGNTWIRAYLNDGTSISVAIQNSSSTQKRLLFNVDINGDKKPNKLGKDIFEFTYFVVYPNKAQNGKFMPFCFNCTREEILSNTSYKCNKNQSGAACTALIMLDGWQIKDDYPW